MEATTEQTFQQDFQRYYLDSNLDALTGNKEVPLAELMKAVKGTSARLLNDRLGRRGPLWQPGFYDHALRGEEDRLAVARYIVANPLRAGLVRRLGDYPHWDSIWL